MLPNINKIYCLLPLVFKKNRSVIFCAALFIIAFSSDSFPSEIEWKLYLKPSLSSGPIITATTDEGKPFTIDNSNISGSISGSEEILDALDGASFLIQQKPVNNPLTIRIILNVQGNSFESIMGINLCLNLDIEAYVNGTKEENQYFFQNSPLIMTIPAGSGLSFLVDQSNCNRNDVVFVYYPGGKFDKEGIETYSQVSGMVAYINKLTTIVGGKNSDLGFSSSTKYDTWFKIKKLFE